MEKTHLAPGTYSSARTSRSIFKTGECVYESQRSYGHHANTAERTEETLWDESPSGKPHEIPLDLSNELWHMKAQRC